MKFLYCKHYVSITNRRQNADIAYCIEAGNNFKGRPILGHKLNGIVIAAGAIIGKNCFLSHQVTIGRNRGAPTIGDNVRVGANCVVFEDVPDNATVVQPKPRIIIKSPDYQYYVANPNDWNVQGE